MSNTYIPTIFKDKISLFFNYFISFIFALLAVFIALSLITFSIRDNSFLTSSDQLSTNFFGDIGSYVASFILYTFGIMGYSLVLFFLIFSVFSFLQKRPSFLFIRLLLFFISLILIPQAFFYLNINFNFL